MADERWAHSLSVLPVKDRRAKSEAAASPSLLALLGLQLALRAPPLPHRGSHLAIAAMDG